MPSPPPARDVAISPSAKAFVVIAAIAVVQFGLLIALAMAQRDTAHVIDVSGSQRMRSQRIAFLVEAARDGRPRAQWADELDATVSSLLAARGEIRRVATGPSGADGRFELDRLTSRYVDAARAIGRDPHDRAAFATIALLRMPLLARFDAAVKVRARRSESQHDRLELALLVSLVALVVSIALAWARIIVPNERRARVTLGRLIDSRRQMRSLFRENPDGIAVYDRDGNVVRGNRVAIELVGATRPLVGRHFAAHVAPDSREATARAFERALAGESVSLETQFEHATGEPIDVAVNIFPHVVDGAIVGAIGVAKDIREIKRARRSMREQSERIEELYRIAAGRGRSSQQQIDDALAVAARRLGCAWAVVTEIVDERVTPIATFGAPPDIEVGRTIDLREALARFVVRAGDVWAVDDLATSLLKDSAAIASSWRSIVAIALESDGSVNGTLGFGDAQPRRVGLSDDDRNYVRLVAALLASALERGRQEKKLDALAFFDALTGLSNRVLLNDRLAELTIACRRHDARFAVHYLDLDRFKAINDRYGHGVGDEILRIVAHRMETCVRATDTIARLGGDEFVIVQPMSGGDEGASELAQRVLEAIAQPCVVEGVEHRLGVSIGVAIYPTDGRDGQTLLERADEALYRAKREGRNRARFSAA